MSAPAPLIFFDASCTLCSFAASRWGQIAQRQGFRLVPLQSEEARSVLHLASGEVPEEMKLQTRSGRILGGLDALRHIGLHVGWACPLALVLYLPVVHALAVAVYHWVARHRHHLVRSCRIAP